MSCLCTMRESCPVCEASWAEYKKREAIEMRDRAMKRAAGLCKCSWSECICDRPELWPEPEYQIGERWKFYGGQDGEWEIEELWKDQRQMLIREVESNRRRIVEWYPGRYANVGTPELRIKSHPIQLPPPE